MAEKKKSAKSAGGPASSQAEGKKKSAGKKVEKRAAAAPAVPMIDTALAAEAAARMIAGKVASSEEQGDQKTESAAFRQLKNSLNKPASQGVSGFIQSTAPQKKSGLPFGVQNQQVRRNQTFGADVNRSGVPRRTGGG